MATLLENLTAAKAGAAAKLAAALTGDYSGAEEFRPDLVGPNGLQREKYVRALTDLLASLNQQISLAEGPWEVTSEMCA